MDKHELLQLDTEELLLLIGKELVKGKRFSQEPSRNNLIERAKKWFNESKEELRNLICSNSTIIETVNSSEKNKRILMLTAVADAISPILLPISPWTASALIIKEGIDVMCPNIEEKKNGL